MAEYIEREAVLREIDERISNLAFYSPYQEETHIVVEGMERARDSVEDAPSADVVEVRHGRWEFDGSDFADIWKCSACGEDWYFEYDPRDAETFVKFCPNCGARMDGE